MTLRRKPEVLINIMPKIMGSNKYLGQEKLPIIVWVIAQASQGDLVTGMFCWAHSLFPTLCAKSSGNPLARDLVLQLLERILSVPKARSILLNGAVRKGERLVPPSSFDLFMRATFPVSSARVKVCPVISTLLFTKLSNESCSDYLKQFCRLQKGLKRPIQQSRSWPLLVLLALKL